MLLTKVFYTRPFRVFSKGFFKENTICTQILGLCSTLAVTNKLENAIAMGLGLIFVLVMGCVGTSLVRRFTPNQYRIITFMMVVSALTIVVDQWFKAYSPELSKQLGAFVGLIITNCIVMGRQEAFAFKNSVGLSAIDALGNGLSYAYSLVIIATIREVLAFGTLLNFRVMPEHFTNCVVMAMAPGAFFLLALYFWLYRGLAKLSPEKE